MGGLGDSLLSLMDTTGTRARLASTAMLVGLGGCGYSATPIHLTLDALVFDSGQVKTIALRGTADPAASDFDDGILFSTRWSVGRAGVRTVELLIDIDRDALPDAIGPGEEPVIIDAGDGEVVAVLRQRDLGGDIALDHVPIRAEVAFATLRREGSRDLSSGWFDLELLEVDGGLYVEIAGVWETRPRATSATVVPGDVGHISPGDLGSGDPGGTGDPSGDPQAVDGDEGDSDAGVVEVIEYDSGCSCPGGETEEELPPEEPDPDPEPTPDPDTGTGTDSGGCDCEGDPEEPDPEPTPDPDSGTETDSGGCDCEGDPEEPDPDPDPEPTPDPDTGTEEESSGCDCAGDPEEPEPASELARQASSGSRAALNRCVDAGKPCVGKKPVRRRVRRRCRRSRLGLVVVISPIFCAYSLSRRRRKVCRPRDR